VGSFIKGEVVVLRFPFSDLTSTKKRPALVLTAVNGDDVILCQITASLPTNAKYAVALKQNDFVSGSLKSDSYIRTDKIFTADSNIVLYPTGEINNTKMIEVIDKLCDLFY